MVLPTENTQIDKEQCSYSYDTPLSPGGIYISLSSFKTYGAEFLSLDKDSNLFLHIQDTWHYSPDNTTSFGVNRRVSLFNRNSEEETELAFDYNSTQDPLTTEDIINKGIERDVAETLVAVLSHQNREKAAVSDSIGDGQIRESRYSKTLEQIENPPRIGPYGWACAECGNTENLWMHLADGFIGCGRKLYGIPTSGCKDGREGAAVRHWEEDPAGRPLAVKLGTITPSGADVYSYAEDDMVIDSELKRHLQHFGINCDTMQATEATMADAEATLNKEFDWSANDDEKDGTPVCEEGFVGLKNLGNTCYINSVIQLISRVTPFARLYLQRKDTDLGQLLIALLGPRYHRQRNWVLQYLGDEYVEAFLKEHPSVYISPKRFRKRATENHKEFKKSQQQDADEFLRYLLESLVDSKALEPIIFNVETQIQRLDNGAVRRSKEEDRVLSLQVPRPSSHSSESAKRSRTEEEPSTYTVEQLLKGWKTLGETTVWDSNEGNVKCHFTRALSTFPAYLFVQIGRFYITDDWKAAKNVARVDMPLELDLSSIQAQELSPDIPIWMDDSIDTDHPLLGVLIDYGFPRERALQAIKAEASRPNRDSGTELEFAVDWCVSHANDPTPMNDSSSSPDIPAAAIEMICSMGFTDLHAKVALIEKQGDVAAATDWLLTEGMSLDDGQLLAKLEQSNVEQNTDEMKDDKYEGETGYEMIGFAVHAGSGCGSGHYIAYIRDKDSWVRINDERCMRIANAPTETGYLYLYRRRAEEDWRSLVSEASY